MSIGEYLEKIRNAVYGREVRESIAKGIETAYNDASEKHDNANMEVKLARGTHSNLNNRLKKMDEVDRETTTQLAQTVDEVTYDKTTQTIRFLANNSVIKTVDVSEVSNDSAIQNYIDSLVSDGHIEGVNLGRNTVTEENLAFEPLKGVRSVNLFDKSKITPGYYFRETGELLENSDLFVSDFIEVESDTIYTTSKTRGIVFYDENKNFISHMRPTQPNNDQSATFTTPATAKYLRLDNNLTHLHATQLTVGSDIKSYENYTNYLKPSDIRLKSIKTEHLKDNPIVIDDVFKNLFNKDTVTKDKYINRTNGELATDTVFTASEFIPIEPNTLYTQTSVATGAWYDINKNYISGIAYNEEQPLLSPHEAFYLRASVSKQNLASHMVVKGSELPNRYVGFWKTIGNQLIFGGSGGQGQSTKEYVYDVLFSENSVIDLWGDSRTHGTGGSGFNHTPTNSGGVQIVGGTEGVFTSPNSHSWANSLADLMEDKFNVTVRNWAEQGKNSNHYIDRMDVLLNQTVNPDLIVLALGTNDRHNMTLSQSRANFENMINNILDREIKAVLLSMPPTTIEEESNVNKNFSLYDLDKMFRELSHVYGIGFVSGYSNSLEYQEEQGLPEDGLLSDGLHENDLGHTVIFKKTIKDLGIGYVKEGSR